MPPSPLPPGAPTAGAVVSSTPIGPPTPSSGWTVAYADAFGAQLGTSTGQDNTWLKGEGNQGCCGNSNEINIERPSQVSVTSEGLKITCEQISTPVNGHSYSCGGISGGGAARSPRLAFNGAAFAIEWRGALPPNMGMADPGVWSYPDSSGSGEFDWPECFGYGSRFTNNGWASSTCDWHWFYSPGSDIEKLNFDASHPPADAEAQHTWTLYIFPTGGGNYRYSVYIDGTRPSLTPDYGGTFSELSPEFTVSSTVKTHLVVTYALRKAESSAGAANEASGAGFPNALTVRSIAVYVDKAHVGSGAIVNEGIAPGTTVK